MLAINTIEYTLSHFFFDIFFLNIFSDKYFSRYRLIFFQWKAYLQIVCTLQEFQRETL